MPSESESIPIPEEVFTQRLPAIEDLGELKLLLHVLHLGGHSDFGFVLLERLLEPTVARSVAGVNSPEPAEERVMRSLERALANGTLIRFSVRVDGLTEVRILPGTERATAALAGLARGDSEAARALAIPTHADVSVYRPNVYAFYERYIGPLTPLVAEQLRDAERSYPRKWIEDAILIAANYNRRNWRYIQSILSQWERAGAPDAHVGRGS